MSFVAGSVGKRFGWAAGSVQHSLVRLAQNKKGKKKHTRERNHLNFESSEFDNFASRSKVRAQARSDWMTRIAFM
jgi:hypothetical protein